MIEANRYKLGLFVVIGLVILVTGLFLTGLRQMFQPTINMVTSFSESVQGIEQGSPVKFSGVPIGKVTRVMMRPSEKIVEVYIEVQTNAFAVNPNDPSFIFYSSQRFRDEIDRGLRCQMEFLGITGLKYIEIDYFAKDSAEIIFLPRPPDVPNHIFYLPSQPSLLSGIKTSFVDLLASLQYAVNGFNKIDFNEINEISDETRQALKTVRRVFEDKSPRIDSTLDAITEGANSISRFATALDSRIENVDVKAQVTQLNKALDSLRSASGAVVRGGMDFNLLADELQNTLRTLNQVLKSLDENPAMLIHGRPTIKPSPLDPKSP